MRVPVSHGTRLSYLKERQGKPQDKRILGEEADGFCEFLKFAYEVLHMGAFSRVHRLHQILEKKSTCPEKFSKYPSLSLM